MYRRDLRWAVAAVVGIVVLVALRPLSSVPLLIALAVVLGVGLLAVAGPAAADAPIDRWRAGLTEHDRVLREYAAVELDPETLLKFPALRDLSAPTTAAFYDSLEAAGELRTASFPGDEAAERYLLAVAQLSRAWSAAEQFAQHLS